ncbi:hypothetical protein IFM89_021892 [Coptis chinensis]|uniref:Pentatricopeptide repeat-containing protein n=1 Tax=Coptis chinensis TaxID=261450 RepID=A0A835HG93_9MAGN|nr:hypothetical protein IFM89_021892 [Coptis chinensis]
MLYFYSLLRKKIPKNSQSLFFSTTTCLLPPYLSPNTHSLILHHCTSPHSLKQAKQAHAFAILHGVFHHSPSVSASLIRTYAKLGYSLTSRLLFDQSSFKHKSILWNALIRAYSITCSYYNAFEIYNAMFHYGVRPDGHTLPFVLKVCADVNAFEKGKEIHGLVFKLGFDGDVFVGNTLIFLYAKKGFWDAKKVFDEMVERNIVSWNSIIVAFSDNGCLSVALEMFLKLNSSSGLKLNSVNLVSILPVCAELGDEENAVGIHGYAVKAGLDKELTVCTALVDVYGKCGKLEASKMVFDEMVERNVVSWSAIIAGFAHNGHAKYALNMFRWMVAGREKPNSVTVSSLLPVLVELELFDLGKEIHAYGIRRDMVSDVSVTNSLIDMYAKSGCIEEASFVFNKMEKGTVVTWNTLIRAYSITGSYYNAFEIYNAMFYYGVRPDDHYVSVCT